MTGLFVTGTSTEVGKSWVTAALATALRTQGHAVRALKPIASGVDLPPGEDAALLAQAAGHPAPEAWTFRAALSPHRAAAMEGRHVPLDAVVEWVRAHAGPVTLVEGAGGWEVPCAPEWCISDLAVRLGWPVLVVARNQLGALNHTLLTVAAIRARGLPLAGVVLNAGADEAARTNREDLAALLPEVRLHVLPEGGTDLGALAAELFPVAGGRALRPPARMGQ